MWEPLVEILFWKICNAGLLSFFFISRLGIDWIPNKQQGMLSTSCGLLDAVCHSVLVLWLFLPYSPSFHPTCRFSFKAANRITVSHKLYFRIFLLSALSQFPPHSMSCLDDWLQTHCLRQRFPTCGLWSSCKGSVGNWRKKESSVLLLSAQWTGKEAALLPLCLRGKNWEGTSDFSQHHWWLLEPHARIRPELLLAGATTRIISFLSSRVEMLLAAAFSGLSGGEAATPAWILKHTYSRSVWLFSLSKQLAGV